MKRLRVGMVGVLLLLLVLGGQMAHATAPRVYSLPIQGEIESGLAAFIARGLAIAERNDGILLLEINTFGGRVDAATEIKDHLLKAKVPVIAYVSERAWSAGALIALSAPQVAMAPGSSMGAAEPRPMDEKTVSALRAEFEATAGRAGRDPRLAGAMVDADLAIEGLVEKGKILTLSAENAVEWGMADVLANSRHEVLAHFGYENYELIPLKPHWAERIARFITNSTISSLLLTLGFLGLVFEITTPGWGVPGTGGLIALVLFFGGRYVTGLAGFEEIGLFILGILLLILEIFVIPGFGLAGILGIIAVIVSVVLVFGNVYAALISLFIALSVSIVAFILLWKRVKQSSFWQRLVLSHSETKDGGYKAPPDFTHLLGQQGVSLTPLRPAGTVMIGDVRYDVVSEGGFVAENSLVEVVLLEGTRVVVREVNKE
ncbi:MAG: nodulation protein NfeD [Firmicutes bacterium]|nr:nodulation protein NfeD [Bacillota bacterium]